MALSIALAQQSFLVGAITRNGDKALQSIQMAREAGADLILFPELALTGYPPEDLLLRPGFIRRSNEALARVTEAGQGIDVIIGHPWEADGRRYNAASWIRDGRVIGRYYKQCLPNYAVFDERRYFQPGSDALVVELKGHRLGLLICEDCWEADPALQAHVAGAELLLVPNASPYRMDKLPARKRMLAQRHSDTGLPMVYLNITGGQDELVFDGRSMLLDGQGEITAIAPSCDETVLLARFEPAGGRLTADRWPEYRPDILRDTYQILVCGLRDYVRNNGFSDVVIGLSGGIDSALTLALAVDAFGAEHVHTVMMPSRHTSELSLELAREQADLLGVEHRSISIEPAFDALQASLAPSFAGRPAGVTEENLQARCRADLLMALSNKFGWMVLSTGNKSELAVGYCTIYGDMAGGFAPIKDCSKTLVYQLAEYRNRRAPAIPAGVIERPPSAELRPDQTDQDSLPPYDLLDQVLYRYVDLDQSIHDIVEQGFDEATVRRIAGLVLINEYKRRQAAPGVRITNKAFGRDRRYPITSGWRDSGQ